MPENRTEGPSTASWPAHSPPAFDTSVAHPARVYDYWLDGKDNFAADREAAERVVAVRPSIRRDIRENRAFLRRTVAYLSHPASDVNAEVVAGGARQYNQPVATPQTRRSQAEVIRFLAGTDAAEHGVVQCHRWHPEPGAAVEDYEVSCRAGIGRKP